MGVGSRKPSSMVREKKNEWIKVHLGIDAHAGKIREDKGFIDN
ncbi:MAG: hypothetical protein ACK4F9_07615 [Brevinematia bacterium]